MYPASGELLRRLKTSHVHELHIEFELSTGRKLTLVDLPTLREGTVSIGNNAIRRTGSLTFVMQEVGYNFSQLLEGDVARIRIFLYNIPLGVFTIKDIAVDSPGAYLQYRIGLQDLAILAMERKASKDYTFYGTPVTVAQDFIATTGLNVRWRQAVSTQTEQTPQTFTLNAGADAWQAARSVLLGVGMEVFFDIEGRPKIQEIPTPSTATAFAIDDLVLAYQKTQGRVKYNHVILMVENDQELPYRVDAYDLRPSAASNFFVGDMPYVQRAKGISSPTAAQDIARRILFQAQERERTDTFSCLQVPIFDLDDVVSRSEEFFILDSISYSLVHNRPMYLVSKRGY